jgi:hypothetical protein
LRQVQIGGDQTLAVIDQDETALEVQSGLGEADEAGGRGATGVPTGAARSTP